MLYYYHNKIFIRTMAQQTKIKHFVVIIFKICDVYFEILI